MLVPVKASFLLSRIYARTILRRFTKFYAVLFCIFYTDSVAPSSVSYVKNFLLYILSIVVTGSEILLEISEIALIGYMPVSLNIRFVVGAL